jgi:hypothetical protein
MLVTEIVEIEETEAGNEVEIEEETGVTEDAVLLQNKCCCDNSLACTLSWFLVV